jgi:hypothetical protein
MFAGKYVGKNLCDGKNQFEDAHIDGRVLK